MKRRYTITRGTGVLTDRMQGRRSGCPCQIVVIFRNEKHRQVHPFRALTNGRLLRRVCNIEIPLKEALPITHRDGVVFINAQHGGNIIAIQLVVREHAQFVKALYRQQKNQSYGNDFFHGPNVVQKQNADNMIFVIPFAASQTRIQLPSYETIMRDFAGRCHQFNF